ncbi:carbon monoxide dehydrogenase subunit G [Streptomyces sp. NPDC020801]|uniref:SRPBCC family protein n=1 Tax=unclassified Streptomyces TaxID=2593676 RepID=UPI0037BCDD59
MKVSGNATLNATIDKVWDALNDPAVLARTIPGCEKLEETGPDAYRMTVTMGVASIKGTYMGDVQLLDLQRPGAFTLKASGAGGPGTVTAEAKVSLQDLGDGRTLLDYDADAVVGGMIGGVGQRVLSGVAKKTASEFFKTVDKVLAGQQPVELPAPSGVPAAARIPQRPAVFTPPAAAPGGASRLTSGDFVKGALFGAVVALLGAVVGGILSRMH